jgi:hypothetical protein
MAPTGVTEQIKIHPSLRPARSPYCISLPFSLLPFRLQLSPLRRLQPAATFGLGLLFSLGGSVSAAEAEELVKTWYSELSRLGPGMLTGRVLCSVRSIRSISALILNDVQA